MKFIARLPEAKYYQLDSQTEKGFKLVDKASAAFAIISPVSKPFDQEWCVLLSPRPGKSDKTKYVTGLNLKLFHISPENIDTPKGKIIREQYKALLA